MNFTKHRVSASEMLEELLVYCSMIISEREEQNANYSDLSASISTETGGVQIEDSNENIILVIKFDDRHNYFYFEEKDYIQNVEMEKRIIIYTKKIFFAYFDECLNQVV